MQSICTGVYISITTRSQTSRSSSSSSSFHFFGSFAFVSFPSSFGRHHILLPLAAVVWGPFCLGGVLFLVAPFICMSASGAALTWIMLSLPFFVLCLTFRSLSGFAFLGSWSCRSGVFACVFRCFSVCVALLSVCGPVVSVLFFGCCRLPSLPDVASLPPAVGPVAP